MVTCSLLFVLPKFAYVNMQLTEENIRQIVRDELDRQGNNNTYSVAPVPRHVHNGVDSLSFPFTNLSDVPSSYQNKTSLMVAVNSTASGLTFVGSSVALTSTTGFLSIPYCGGTPTGVATKGAMVYDTTNNKLYFYNTSWKSVTLT